MVVEVIGILEDGSKPSSKLPRSARTSLDMPRGVDAIVRVRIMSRGGPIVYLAPGDAATLSITKNPQYGPLLTKAGTPNLSASPGTMEFLIASADWKTVDPYGAGGRFLFDVWLSRTSGRDAVVPLSAMMVEAAATPVP